MSYPKAYIAYLVYFHGLRDYFECHEVLEEKWKEDEKRERKAYWVGLIQIAVSLYHQRRNNYNGAEKLMENAIQIIRKEKPAINMLALDYERLLSLLEMRYTEIKERKPYRSMNLPITSGELLQVCQGECERLHCTWGVESDLSNKTLVHKHRLRDRSDVITERERQKKRREVK